MAAAWLSSTISSMFLISRASSMICWPSTTCSPASCSANSMAVSARSTPTGMSVDAGLAQQRHDLLGVGLHQAERGRDRAAHAEHAGPAGGRRQPVAIEPVMDGGRAEVPDHGLVAAGQQREAAELVALPFADLGAGDVADVVDVEEQQRAAVAGGERGLRPGQAVVLQSPEIDAGLEVDPHLAGCRDLAVPAPVRVGVLGSENGRIERARHGDSSKELGTSCPLRALSPRARSGRTKCLKAGAARYCMIMPPSIISSWPVM